jgi:hypothetical protein
MATTMLALMAALTEATGKVDLSLHYGDRTLTLAFTR